MKTIKFILPFFLFAVLVYSCKKSNPVINSPIIGNWTLTKQADTFFYRPGIWDTTVICTPALSGYIRFQPDGTVYRSTSFRISTLVYGTTLYFAVHPVIPPIFDTAKFVINNNIISNNSRLGFTYKDSIAFVDEKTLIISTVSDPSTIRKSTFYYSK